MVISLVVLSPLRTSEGWFDVPMLYSEAGLLKPAVAQSATLLANIIPWPVLLYQDDLDLI